jgi:hypothetical protein
MSILTVLRYLVGQRDAILRVATTRQAIWLGVLFVLAAGLAREYDAKDLSREPWYLLLPLGASLATSFLLYLLIYGVALWKNWQRWPFLATYGAFLRLYWMTAPLALLYALPVERFLTEQDATRANLMLLAVVSVWRVSLMTRAVQVYFGAPPLAAFVVIMLFADTLALLAVFFAPVPLMSVMGGVVSPRQQVVMAASLWVGCLGGLTWLVWLVDTVFVGSPAASPWEPSDSIVPGNSRVHVSLWCLAAALVLGWVLVLPTTQREQQLRSEAESQLQAGNIRGAVLAMSAHDRDEFPPLWDPPPAAFDRFTKPTVVDVLWVALDEPDCAAWVRDDYLAKLKAQLGHSFFTVVGWRDMDSPTRDKYLDVLSRIPLTEDDVRTLDDVMAREDDGRRKGRIRALIESSRDAR